MRLSRSVIAAIFIFGGCKLLDSSDADGGAAREASVPMAGADGASAGSGGANGGSMGGGDASAANAADAAAGKDAAVVDAPGDGTVADADPHGGASRWIPFTNPATTSTFSFDRCFWASDNDGFCALFANKTSAKGSKTSDLYKTIDGGKTWSLVTTIDGGNTAIDGSMSVYVLSPTEIWYTTAFVGMGYSGSIGRSTNGGQSFQSLTESVDKALADPGASPTPDFPLWGLVKVGSRIWVGSYSDYVATSSDGGATWERIASPLTLNQAPAPDLIGTKTDLILRYYRNSKIELYRWSGTAFAKVEASFPVPSGTDHGDTWWRASPYSDGIVFVDRRPWFWWGWPFAVHTTIDGGKSFQKVLSGQSKSTSDVEGLRDALVVSGAQPAIYVCGVFSEAGKSYDQIRKSTDGGQTWSTLHSEPSGTNHTSVALDSNGHVHAMRHTTDGYANTYSYTGQYVLP
jgi:photosystem II stability/assembly factor-like uncharacterized protein